MFSPRVTKSIGRVRFVPLADMTPRDWAWLDFDNTRTVAQNRIASAIMRGQLRGFFQVMITEKAAKSEYFWPATATEIAMLENDDISFFGHEAEVDNETAAAEGLARLRTGFLGVPTWVLVLIAGAIAVVLAAEERNDESLQAAGIDEEFLDELRQEDIEILLSSIMMWEYSLEEAEALLDDLPESDEVDEVRDWINDRVAEIDRARSQIAAGRGIAQSYS